MKKFLRCLLIGGGILFLAAIGTFFLIGLKAPDYASKRLTNKLKVPVTIENASISFSGITVNGFTIQNLPKSILPKALSIQTARCENNLLNYLDKDIAIEEISLENIYLGLEFDSPKGTNGNWTVLMKNLQSSETPTSPKDAKSVNIKNLVLTNIQVEVAYKSSGVTKKLPLIPKIVLHNINSSQGLTEEQIMQTVLGQMLKSVFVQENLKNMFEGVLEQPQDALNTLLQPFKGLF